MSEGFRPVDDFDLPPRQPLYRDAEPERSFPTGHLGTMVDDMIAAVTARTLAPVAISGQSVLAAISMAVQGHADVILPTGQRRPCSCFFLTVAETGERKSAVDHYALKAVRDHEDELRASYDDDYRRYKDRLAAYEKARDQIEKNKKLGQDDTVRELQALGSPPAAPLSPYLTSTEPTLEGLTGRQMRDGHPSLGVFSAEGGQFIGGVAMSADNRLKTAAGLSGLWDGDPVRRVRAGDGVSTLYGRRLALHLMVQPGVAAQVFSDPVLKDQGLLSRLLVVAPAPISGTRTWREVDPGTGPMLDRFNARMRHILRTPPPLAEGTRNELHPRPIPMDDRAAALWVAYYNAVEERLGESCPYRAIKGLANKLPEHAARLAACLALFDDLDAAALTGDWMAAGIEMAEHYASEALRLIDIGATNPDLLLAEKVSQWAQKQGKAFRLPDLYQKGPAAVRDAATARRIVGILKDHRHFIEDGDCYLFNPGPGSEIRPRRRVSPTVGAI
ncbi:MAG: YfjI family protein [Sphingomonadales bacterium]